MARVPRHYEEFVNDLKDDRAARTALEYALAFRDYRRMARLLNKKVRLAKLAAGEQLQDGLNELRICQERMDQAWAAFERAIKQIDKQLAAKAEETSSMF